MDGLGLLFIFDVRDDISSRSWFFDIAALRQLAGLLILCVSRMTDEGSATVLLSRFMEPEFQNVGDAKANGAREQARIISTALSQKYAALWLLPWCGQIRA